MLLSGTAFAQTSLAPWHDSALPTAQRVDALVAQMTIEERAIPRLGVPAYDWWSEALHGVANNGFATVFPEPVGRSTSSAQAQTSLNRREPSMGDERQCQPDLDKTPWRRRELSRIYRLQMSIPSSRTSGASTSAHV